MPAQQQSSTELPCRCTAPARSRAERPCPIHVDVVFKGGEVDGRPARLDGVVFRNHYVASTTVYQRRSAWRQIAPDAHGSKGPRWVVVLRDEPLMAHPHFEDDAQSQRTLYATQFLPAFDPALCGAGAGGASKDGGGEAPLGSLRFRLTQPSMMWNGGMELRNLRCFMFKRPPE